MARSACSSRSRDEQLGERLRDLTLGEEPEVDDQLAESLALLADQCLLGRERCGQLLRGDEAAFDQDVAEPAALVHARGIVGGRRVWLAGPVCGLAPSAGGPSCEVKIVPEFTPTLSAGGDGN